MKNNLTTIYVVRHGESSFNAGKTMDLDSSLTDEGKVQSKKIAIHLKRFNFDIILSSKLNRAIQTAEIINKHLNTKLIVGNSLEERGNYSYAYKINMEIETLDEEMISKMKNMTSEEKMNFKLTPEMESPSEAAERVLEAIKKYSERELNNILLISHGNLMQSILTYLKWCKYDELTSIEIKNTNYFVLELIEDKFKVIKTHKINKHKGEIRIW